MSKRLGKGLDALIPSLSIHDDDKVVEIPLSQLRANPYQPRKTFNDEVIQELAESIRQHGVIQPIIVRSVLKGYEIIAGERRFRASQYCGSNDTGSGSIFQRSTSHGDCPDREPALGEPERHGDCCSLPRFDGTIFLNPRRTVIEGG